MKSVILSAVLLATSFAVTSAQAQQQCPITCVIPVGATAGTCSNNSAVACTTDAECIGATVAAACPCGGPANPAGQANTWKNHGQYQSCVVKARNKLRQQACSTAGIASCTARSTCGKAGRVLCCKVASTGTCALAAGSTSDTCSNNGAACATNADCNVVTGPSWTHDASWCVAHGGYASGTGSKCAGCEPPVACCLPSTTAGQPGTCAVLSAQDCSTQGGSTTAGAAATCTGVTCP